MRTHYNQTPVLQGSIVAIGAFDGVHLGHQQVIEKAVKKSREFHVPSVVYTFDPTPRSYFQGARILTHTEHKLNLLELLGVDHVIVAKFDEHYMNRPYNRFIEELNILSPIQIHVGGDFRFGKNRVGDVNALKTHFDVELTDVVCCSRGDRISSTRIRDLIAQNKYEDAATLLGRSSLTYHKHLA